MSKLNFKHDEYTKYKFYKNNEKIDIDLKRIIIGKNYFKNLIKIKFFPTFTGYFIYGEKGFNSFLFNNNIDLIIVDSAKNILLLEKNFIKNKITNYYKDAKYIYILPKNTISYNKIESTDKIWHSRI